MREFSYLGELFFLVITVQHLDTFVSTQQTVTTLSKNVTFSPSQGRTRLIGIVFVSDNTDDDSLHVYPQGSHASCFLYILRFQLLLSLCKCWNFSTHQSHTLDPLIPSHLAVICPELHSSQQFVSHWCTHPILPLELKEMTLCGVMLIRYVSV